MTDSVERSFFGLACASVLGLLAFLVPQSSALGGETKDARSWIGHDFTTYDEIGVRFDLSPVAACATVVVQLIPEPPARPQPLERTLGPEVRRSGPTDLRAVFEERLSAGSYTLLASCLGKDLFAQASFRVSAASLESADAADSQTAEIDFVLDDSQFGRLTNRTTSALLLMVYGTWRRGAFEVPDGALSAMIDAERFDGHDWISGGGMWCATGAGSYSLAPGASRSVKLPDHHLHDGIYRYAISTVRDGQALVIHSRAFAVDNFKSGHEN